MDEKTNPAPRSSKELEEIKEAWIEIQMHMIYVFPHTCETMCLFQSPTHSHQQPVPLTPYQ